MEKSNWFVGLCCLVVLVLIVSCSSNNSDQNNLDNPNDAPPAMDEPPQDGPPPDMLDQKGLEENTPLKEGKSPLKKKIGGGEIGGNESKKEWLRNYSPNKTLRFNGSGNFQRNAMMQNNPDESGNGPGGQKGLSHFDEEMQKRFDEMKEKLISSCVSKSQGDVCSVDSPMGNIEGVCESQDNELVCMLERKDLFN